MHSLKHKRFIKQRSISTLSIFFTLNLILTILGYLNNEKDFTYFIKGDFSIILNLLVLFVIILSIDNLYKDYKSRIKIDQAWLDKSDTIDLLVKKGFQKRKSLKFEELSRYNIYLEKSLNGYIFRIYDFHKDEPLITTGCIQKGKINVDIFIKKYGCWYNVLKKYNGIKLIRLDYRTDFESIQSKNIDSTIDNLLNLIKSEMLKPVPIELKEFNLAT